MKKIIHFFKTELTLIIETLARFETEDNHACSKSGECNQEIRSVLD